VNGRLGEVTTLSPEERKAKDDICNKCNIRRDYAKMDFHFNWIDCPYNCPNDYEHTLKESAIDIHEKEPE